jgi:transposase
MAQQNKVTQLQERLEILQRHADGESDAQIAAALGWSYWTVRKWRRRGQGAGRTGLTSTIGRPATGALSSFGEGITQAVKELRHAHPGWGPQTLRIELEKDPRFADGPLPSRARIAAYLKEQGLTRSYKQHTELAQTPSHAPTVPHEEWELDAQGVQMVAGVGQVSVINIADGYSRLKVESWGCVGRSKAGTEDYQLACRRGFLRYGLPQRLSLDHDTVFYDSNNPSPFPARFHLWLLGLGIEVRFITHPPPTEHAVIERTHTVLAQQALAQQSFATPTHMQTSLDERREFLNTEYPSRTWQGQAPLVALPQAQHAARSYTPETESQCLELHRVYTYLAQHRWFRLVSAKGQFTLGGYRYGLGQTWRDQTLDITFDPQTVEFICTSADGSRVQRVSAKGLSKTELMGELPPWELLPAYQRRLPFSPAAQRENILYQDMSGTTL